MPKYFTCPGMSLRSAAYNMELAMQHPTVVIVEGMMDVWRLVLAQGSSGISGVGFV